MEDPEILFEQRGKLGLVTLNRPKALNALTYGMIRALDAQLEVWAGDDSIGVVAIMGAGGKALAAGGDIRWLYDQGLEDGRRNWTFFADEYRLNTRIKFYPKPYVGIMDGIVMGGGVGVSIHGSLRVATERTVFAMPETGIGLFPDVGATWFLPRLPGETGMWLGLTGARLRGQQALAAGICDVLVASADLEGLLDALAAGRMPAPESGGALPERDAINEAFAGDSVEAILDALTGSEWADKTRETLLAKSPTSTRLAFRQIRMGAELGFHDCMRLEYRLARYCMTHPDFYEGVRALIVEKDNTPHWSPATLAEADDAFVAEAFADLGADELSF